MKRIISLVVALLIMGFISPNVAHAEPSKIIIGLSGWLTPGFVFKSTMQRTGWVTPSDEYIDFPFMNTSGTELEASQDALPRLEALVNDRCFKGIPCELHGVSRGSDVLVWVENQMGWPRPGVDVILHESGDALNGSIRSPILSDPKYQFLVQPIFVALGHPNTEAPLPTPGTQNYYNNGSAISNLAPQCYDIPAITTMVASFPVTHMSQRPKSDPSRYWRGTDGTDNYEYGSGYVSGADMQPCKEQ